MSTNNTQDVAKTAKLIRSCSIGIGEERTLELFAGEPLTRTGDYDSSGYAPFSCLRLGVDHLLLHRSEVSGS